MLFSNKLVYNINTRGGTSNGCGVVSPSCRMLLKKLAELLAKNNKQKKG